MNQAKFDVFLPIDNIQKSKGKNGKQNYIVEGYASTDARDFQGERVMQDGLNIDYLLNHGYIDIEHDTDNICGVPLEDTHVDKNGLYMRCLLLGDNPDVQRMVTLQKDFEEAGVDRSMGFSIEGQVLERDSVDDSIVRSVNVTGCAMTMRPANPDAYIDSWESLVKSVNADKDLQSIQKAWLAGSGISPQTQSNGAALRTESLEGALNTLAAKVKRLKEQGVKANEMQMKLAEELSGEPTALGVKQLFLQIYTGISARGAKSVLQQMHFNDVDFEHAFNPSDATDNTDSMDTDDNDDD